MILSKKFLSLRIKRSDVGFTYTFSNSLTPVKLFVLEAMIGLRFGQFALTKRLGSGIHIKKNKKGKKKKNG